MSVLVTLDYRNAPSGVGPLAVEWGYSPHRLIYDLCAEVDNLRSRLRDMQGALRDVTIPPEDRR